MSKIISIKDDLYKKLASIKGKESFSIVIEKLIERKTNTEAVLACAGKGRIDEKAVADLKKGWKKWTEKYV